MRSEPLLLRAGKHVSGAAARANIENALMLVWKSSPKVCVQRARLRAGEIHPVKRQLMRPLLLRARPMCSILCAMRGALFTVRVQRCDAHRARRRSAGWHR